MLYEQYQTMRANLTKIAWVSWACCLPCKFREACTHTQAHAHTCISAHSYTGKHTQANIHKIKKHIHIQIHTFIYIHINTLMHICTHMDTHTYTYRHVHTEEFIEVELHVFSVGLPDGCNKYPSEPMSLGSVDDTKLMSTEWGSYLNAPMAVRTGLSVSLSSGLHW